jgi:site-specific DNA recombinase
MIKTKSTKFKIGLYIRVSTEEQAENPEGSIRNQEQRLRDFVRLKNMDGGFGDIVEVFSDPGISAKDMNRPSLQRMLSKVQTSEINLVMVTDLSRLTRSTKDFGILWEYLSDQGCKFQSLRENFDSTTAAGEMIMFTLANFAQFERKQTAERISHAFQARAKRGLYNGGSVPLGYRIDDTRQGHLVVVPDEAELVKVIFKTFLKEQTLAQTAKSLNDKGLTTPRMMKGGGGIRAKDFRISMVHSVLKQPGYTGVRRYKTRDGFEETKAVWDAIIDQTTYARVQKILEANKSRKKPHSETRYPYLLSGFLFCKTCGDRMAGKSAHGKLEKIAYYEHTWAMKAQSGLSKKVFTCEPHRILAKRIEPVVWQEVKAFLLSPEMAKAVFSEAKEKAASAKGVNESDKLKRKIGGVKSQIEALAERVGLLPKGIDPGVLFDQLAKLQRLKLDFETELAKQAIEMPKDQPLAVDDFKAFTKGLRALIEKEDDPVVRGHLIQSLVKRIDVHKTGIDIQFHVGQSYYLREFGDLKESPGSRPFFVQNGDGKPKTKAAARPLEKYIKGKCSNSLQNGGGAGSLTPVPEL